MQPLHAVEGSAQPDHPAGQGGPLPGEAFPQPAEAVLRPGVGGRGSGRCPDEPSSGLGHRSAPLGEGQLDAAIRARLLALEDPKDGDPSHAALVRIVRRLADAPPDKRDAAKRLIEALDELLG